MNIKKLTLLSIFLIFGTKKGFTQVQQTLSGGQPLMFTSIGNDTYNKSVLYHDLSNGFFIDLAKTSNDINSNPIDFKINARGGLNHFFTLKGENGNVGIGTSIPKSKLHIFGQIDGSFNGLIIDNRKNYGTNSGINETSRILLSLSENGTTNPLNRIFGIIEAGTISESDSSNGRLSFYTRKNGNAEEKMRITHEGNVGIGTINPNSKLEILSSAHDTPILNIVSKSFTGGSSDNMFQIRQNSEGDGWLQIGDRYTNSGEPNKVRIHSNGNSWFNGGNVGIGTINPNSKLEISSSAYSTPILNIISKSFTGGSSDNMFQIRQNSEGDGWLQIGDRYTNSGEPNKVRIHSKGNSWLNGGNVGIGTSNPDMKLTVKGNIHAEEVKIDLNVPAPDYVFKEDYNLRSIEEVESFIKENSHLPEIPSAKQFEKNGIMQAEMDMNLLKKIEELTLYTIRQQKEIESLKKENQEVKLFNVKLLELQSRLEKLESEK